MRGSGHHHYQYSQLPHSQPDEASRLESRQVARLSSMAFTGPPHSPNAVSIERDIHQVPHCENTHLANFNSEGPMLCFRNGR